MEVEERRLFARSEAFSIEITLQKELERSRVRLYIYMDTYQDAIWLLKERP